MIFLSYLLQFPDVTILRTSSHTMKRTMPRLPHIWEFWSSDSLCSHLCLYTSKMETLKMPLQNTAANSWCRWCQLFTKPSQHFIERGFAGKSILLYIFRYSTLIDELQSSHLSLLSGYSSKWCPSWTWGSLCYTILWFVS